MQKGFTPVYFLIGILVILAVAGGAYYFGRSSVKPISESQSAASQVAVPASTPISTAKPISTNINPNSADWKEIRSDRCGIGIKYPQEWTAKEIEVAGSIPDYNENCLTVNSPDYKIIPQSDGFGGTAIFIQRTRIGTVFKSPVKNISTTINTPDDWIKAENSSVSISNESGSIDLITNISDQSFGNLKGKLCISSAAATDYNFIFSGGNYIYRVIWSKTYSGQYKDQLESIVSTIQLPK